MCVCHWLNLEKSLKERNLAHEHDVIYIRAKFRKVTKKRNLAREHDVIYIRAKFRKVTKKKFST